MTTLYTSIEENLKDFLESLTPEDIEDKVPSTTFHKGRQYYEWKLVGDAAYTFDKNKLTARVEGSRDYHISIDLQKGDVNASCSCPLDGLCKHITAVLLVASHESNAIEVAESREAGSHIYEYLLGLSKEELVSMVVKHAPEEFLLQIHNRHASASEALSSYNKAEAAIRKLFSNTELLYSPSEFSDALEKHLNRLLGLEHQLQTELSELIFYIIREVEDAFDKGYLYDDDFNTSFEQPAAFGKLVAHYINALPYEAKNKFLKRLDEALHNTTYTTFDALAGLSHESFDAAELPAVKAMLLNEYESLSPTLAEEYYDLVRPLLSEQEKEILLLRLKEKDSRWLLELAELYKKQDRALEAIKMIRMSLSSNPQLFAQEQVYLCYLDLLSTHSPEELAAVSVEAIHCCASCSIIEKIASISPEDLVLYERLLEQKNPQALLEYFEKEGRTHDALGLLKRTDSIWDHHRSVFFKRHKQEFPQEAVEYFTQVIDKNLQYTGNAHYYTIIEALKQIRQVDQAQTATLVADIRTNYKRRTNLMNLLAEV